MNGDSYVVRIYRRETDVDGQRAWDRVRQMGRVEPVDGSPPTPSMICTSCGRRYVRLARIR